MSISDHIDGLLGEHRLYAVVPLLPGERVRRRMVVTADVDAVIMPPFGPYATGARHADFRQTLDSFVAGEEISISENPKKKPPDTFLARVCPVDQHFWQIRALLDSGMRLLGAFAAKDYFVGLTYNYRESMNHNQEVAECMDVWNDYFPATMSPLSSTNVADFLSENYHVC